MEDQIEINLTDEGVIIKCECGGIYKFDREPCRSCEPDNMIAVVRCDSCGKEARVSIL
jgi:hypothetical protein